MNKLNFYLITCKIHINPRGVEVFDFTLILSPVVFSNVTITCLEFSLVIAYVHLPVYRDSEHMFKAIDVYLHVSLKKWYIECIINYGIIII